MNIWTNLINSSKGNYKWNIISGTRMILLLSLKIKNISKPLFWKSKSICGKILIDLRLHWKKVKIKRWNKGVDFLGYVGFPHHTVLRTKTKKRMLKKIKVKARAWKNGNLGKKFFNQTLQSYLGVSRHCRWRALLKEIKNIIFCD